MSRPRLRLVHRGLTATPARTVLMVVMLAVSVLTVTAVLTARAAVARAVHDGYLATSPASATLDVPGGARPGDLDAVRAVPGVADVARRGTATATIAVGENGEEASVRLFVADAGDPLRLAGVQPHSAWPPAEGAVLMERSSLTFLGAHVGDDVRVALPGGSPVVLRVSASVHDGALAASSQEQTAYAYVTADTARRLGITDQERLLLRVDAADGRSSGNRTTITDVATRAAGVLASRGVRVERIDVPPPLRHPHEGQMRTVGLVLASFGAGALLLSSLLVAVMLGGTVAAQTVRIGAMKAVGATDAQVLGVYLAQAAVIAAVSTAVGLVPGVALGRELAARAGGMMNLDTAGLPVPAWVWAVAVTSGLLAPFLAALVPLLRVSRVSVRQAIDEASGRAGFARNGRAPRLPAVLAGDRPMGFALANLARRPARLALAVGVLALAGALFLTGVDTAAGWRALVDDGVGRRHYDLQLTLRAPAPADRASSLVARVPGVADVEGWGSVPLTLPEPGGVPVTRTYPDLSHSSFTLLAPPAGSRMVTLPLREGRLPDPSDPADADAVVVNQLVPGLQVPGLTIGDRVDLLADGRPLRIRVVGIVADFGTQAAVYAGPRVYATAIGAPAGAPARAADATTAAAEKPEPAGKAGASDPDDRSISVLRVATTEHDPAVRRDVLRQAAVALTGAGMSVEQAYTVDTLKAALDGHVLVLADALLVIGPLMGFVGLLGLASTLGTTVTERTSEFGVLHALGAGRARVAGQVVLEGIATAVGGVAVAAVAAVPLTVVFARIVGVQAFRQPLPWQYSIPAVTVWFVVAVLGAAVAASGAASRASRLTVRQAMSAV